MMLSVWNAFLRAVSNATLSVLYHLSMAATMCLWHMEEAMDMYGEACYVYTFRFNFIADVFCTHVSVAEQQQRR